MRPSKVLAVAQWRWNTDPKMTRKGKKGAKGMHDLFLALNTGLLLDIWGFAISPWIRQAREVLQVLHHFQRLRLCRLFISDDYHPTGVCTALAPPFLLCHHRLSQPPIYPFPDVNWSLLHTFGYFFCPQTLPSNSKFTDLKAVLFCCFTFISTAWALLVNCHELFAFLASGLREQSCNLCLRLVCSQVPLRFLVLEQAASLTLW